MWVWKGDRVAETLLSNFGVRTTPLHIAEVNTGLETGMIDAFYSPPLAAITSSSNFPMEKRLPFGRR